MVNAVKGIHDLAARRASDEETTRAVQQTVRSLSKERRLQLFLLLLDLDVEPGSTHPADIVAEAMAGAAS